ncbi:MAG TPA: SHOCT domain-containing protein [Ilumatobacteraceae bacterium]|nr:SHOCT domain-containing protein [Ilumatobacteraceae bacterium]
MFGKPRRGVRKELESEGTRAVATVTEIASRGVSVTSSGNIAGAEVGLKTTLQIQPPGGMPSFELKCTLRYSQFHTPSVGDRISVLYDPDDLDHIMLDPNPAPPSSTVTTRTVDLGTFVNGVKVEPGTLVGGIDIGALIAQATAAGNAQVIDLSGAGVSADPLDRLAKAAALHQQGVLTDAEFAEQKARILGTG